MDRASRIPNLTLPFGALGALVGWVSASALQNPIFRAGRDLNRPVAAVGGGLTAALLGAYLTRWAHAQVTVPFAAGDPLPWIRLTLPLAAGGALTGALVGAIADNPGDGLQLGIACALAAVPLCATVLSAALRAERARHGSLVADTDRREVWAMLVLVAAIATLAELPNGPGWTVLGLPAPWLSLGIAFTAVPLALLLHLRDRMARRALAAETRDLRDREQERAAPAELPTLDLGLGDDLRARYAQGANAYRDHEREIALVRGDPEEAGRAIVWAVRRGALCLVLVTLVALAHVAATGPWFQHEYARILCDRREQAGCAGVARILDRRNPHDPRIGGLFLRGCDIAHPVHCEELVSWFQLDSAHQDQPEAVSAVKEACSMGYGYACRALGDMAARAGDDDRAVDLRLLACRRGHQPSCAGR